MIINAFQVREFNKRVLSSPEMRVTSVFHICSQGRQLDTPSSSSLVSFLNSDVRWMCEWLCRNVASARSGRACCVRGGKCCRVPCQKNNATPLKVIWGFVGEDGRGGNGSRVGLRLWGKLTTIRGRRIASRLQRRPVIRPSQSLAARLKGRPR